MTEDGLRKLNHHQLCMRAAAWLRANRKCDPVLTRVASAGEIPDAIGWSSSYKQSGSIVVECKTSRSDFYADKKKYIEWKHPKWDSYYPGKRITLKEAAEQGYTSRPVPRMGDYRYFLCPSGTITPEMVQEHAPDHGLLWIDGKRIKVIVEAPRREQLTSPEGEIRYLRFALIHLRDNISRHGCEIDLTSATRFFGASGIQLPNREAVTR